MNHAFGERRPWRQVPKACPYGNIEEDTLTQHGTVQQIEQALLLTNSSLALNLEAEALPLSYYEAWPVAQ